MKLAASFLFFFLIFGAQAQKSKVSLDIKFTGIEEGYDHITKYEIYIDDYLIMTTTEQKESIPVLKNFKTTRGNHVLKVVNYTFYNGNWELTNRDNDYTLDGTVEQKINFNKKTLIKILYDLDNPPVPTVEVI